ncbi:hypothetical protein J7I98_23730 [Streptomyces sp. ISL-98]|uniref:hypothetical protein n=1 Tax=Streptomyces sp. ISL-98 TaxID=2819192 RepID=UPI001BEC4C56|nr:hypothetical protein [Streptomyces sp. ISL-98]MBT2508842.1 hypothetical protein [Streptomyces sp. ISL-98]
MADPKRVRANTAAENSAAAKYNRVRYRDNRHPDTRGSALGDGEGCWCGQAMAHDWPGKAAGTPHPRETEEQR